MTDENDTAFVERVRARLRASAEEITPTEAKQLKAARFRALAELNRPSSARPSRRRWRWAPAGVLAASVAVALVAYLRPSGPVDDGIGALEDLDLLLAEGELEMYEELEFFEWLDTADAG